MIIDFHTHSFPEKIADSTIDALSKKAHIVPHIRAVAPELLSSMREAGVDCSVILPVATAERQVVKLNDAAAILNEKYAGEGLFSFGAMHPEFSDYRSELLRVKELGLKGIKIHPVYQGVDLDDIRFLRILERAAELSLIVVTHAGLDVGYPGVVRCSPGMCLNAVREVGSFPFILAHMGGWKNWDEVLALLPGTGVYLDTAFSTEQIEPLSDGYWKEPELAMLSGEQFMKFVKAFGADHILFGTDSPWTDQKRSRAFIEALPLSDSDKKRILGENAEKLLGSDLRNLLLIQKL